MLLDAVIHAAENEAEKTESKTTIALKQRNKFNNIPMLPDKNFQ